MKRVKKCGEFFNFFAWSQYYPDYQENVHPTDFCVQLLLSLAAGITAIILIWQGLAAVAASPIVELQTITRPSPAMILELFEEQAGTGTVQGLTCSCTSLGAPLSSVSSWDWEVDAFCPTLQAALGGSTFFAAGLLDDVGNVECMNSSVFTTFVSNITALATATRLFDVNDPSFSADVFAFAISVERALCGTAFGTTPLNFVSSMLPSTAFGNACDNDTNSEEGAFLPSGFK
jgi:hypothetical protein